MENDDCFADRGEGECGSEEGGRWIRCGLWKEGGREKEGVGDKRLWNKEEEEGRQTNKRSSERRFQNRLIKQNMRGLNSQGTIERTSVHDERGGERLRLCRFVLHHSALSNIC